MNHTNNDNNNAPLEKSVSTATSTTTTTASIERKLLEWIFYIICVVIYKLIFNLYKNYTRGTTYDKYKENQQPNGFDSNENDNHESNANNNDDSDYDDANDDCEERKQKQKNDDSKCAYILQLIITESNNELNQTIKNPTKAFNSDNINIQKQQRKKYLLIFCNKNQNSACQTKRSSTSTTTTANDPNYIGKIEYNNCHFYCCGYCYCNCQLCCCGYCRFNQLRLNSCFFVKNEEQQHPTTTNNNNNNFGNSFLFKILNNIYENNHNGKQDIITKTSKMHVKSASTSTSKNGKLLAKAQQHQQQQQLTTNVNFFCYGKPKKLLKKKFQQETSQRQQFYMNNNNNNHHYNKSNDNYRHDQRLKSRNLCKYYVSNQRRRRRRRRRRHLCCYIYTATTTVRNKNKTNYYHKCINQSQQALWCNCSCYCCCNIKNLPKRCSIKRDMESQEQQQVRARMRGRKTERGTGGGGREGVRAGVGREGGGGTKIEEEKRFLKFMRRIFIYILYKTILINKTTIIAQRHQQQYMKKSTHDNIDMSFLTTTTTQSNNNVKNLQTQQQQQYEQQQQQQQHRYKNVIVVVGKSNLVWLFIGLVWFKGPKVVNCLYYQQQHHQNHQQHQRQNNQQQQQQQQHIFDTTTNNQHNKTQQEEQQQKSNSSNTAIINLNLTTKTTNVYQKQFFINKLKKQFNKKRVSQQQQEQQNLKCAEQSKTSKRSINNENISWDILQKEAEMEEKSDRDRLESIKNQILTKLGLSRKPNITQTLPKQFVWDTIYRANGLNIMNDFETMIKNQSRQRNDKKLHQVIDLNSFTDERIRQLKKHQYYTPTNKQQPVTKYQFNDDEIEDHDDDYIGSTQEIILFAENGHKNLYHQGLVEFSHPKSQQQNQLKYTKLKSINKQQEHRLFVSFAELHLKVDRIKKEVKKKFNKKHKIKIWIFQLMDKEISTTMRTGKRDINEFAQFCASFDVNTKHLGWQKIDLTTTVREWFERTAGLGSGTELKLLIDCSGCGNEFKLQLFDMNKKPKRNCRAIGNNLNDINEQNVCEDWEDEPNTKEFDANRPFLVLHTETKRLSRVRRRAIDCSGALNGQCCKESFYVSFKALGWDDWIIAPRGYFANYCRGDCTGPYRTPDTFQTFHAHFIEEYRKMGLLNGMNPCCAPIKFSSMSLIYYGDDGIIKRDLPKMVVDECGCP